LNEINVPTASPRLHSNASIPSIQRHLIPEGDTHASRNGATTSPAIALGTHHSTTFGNN
jgi:hypothetical protein